MLYFSTFRRLAGRVEDKDRQFLMSFAQKLTSELQRTEVRRRVTL